MKKNNRDFYPNYSISYVLIFLIIMLAREKLFSIDSIIIMFSDLFNIEKLQKPKRNHKAQLRMD